MFSKYFLNYKLLKNYTKHNNSIFPKNKHHDQIFLVEFNGWQVQHIGYSYLANFFSEKKKCNVVAFDSHSLFKRHKETILEKLKWVLGIFFKINNFGVYSSFGTQNFLKPKYDDSIRRKSLKKFKHFYSKNRSLKDLENLCVEKIWVGDLIYASYLKKFSEHTVDLNSENFKIFFLGCVNNFYFWLNYFNKNKVKGLVTSHSVYTFGIPTRIADYKKIQNFVFGTSNIINTTNTTSYKYKRNGSAIYFRYYKKIFNKIKKSETRKCLDLGKKYLNKILDGETKYYYLKKTTFSKNKDNDYVKYFNKKNKIKVLIYSHLFTDSPHIYGNHFFPDFFEWLKFLGKIIKKTNYEWYIKSHPNEDKTTKKVIKIFLKKNPNVKLLPKNLSNLLIIKNNIKFALTIYGTVASELPAFGIKVINASKNNPHFNYNFSINPKNVFEYEKMLLNLKKVKFKINKKDLFEYHYMKNHYSLLNDYLFDDFGSYTNFENGRQILLTNKCYKYWLEKFSLEKHNKVKTMYEKFIKSGDYMPMSHHQ